MMMERLVEMLGRGGYSCVIANGDDVRSFTQRGVADLYQLSRCEPEFLRGAYVADKVVGKGAAALMASCGVVKISTHIISEGALALLESEGVEVEYGELVPHIINRDRSGWCPVEWLCREESSTESIINVIDKFIKNNRK